MKDKEISILLVENDDNLGAILKAYFEANGYPTLWTKNGKKALIDYKREKPFFCIFDVKIPGMKGFDLAREIRENDTITPIVFLTANNSHEDIMEGFDVGADDYIIKPFDMEELMARIKAIYRRVYVSNTNVTEFTLGSYYFDYQHRLLKRKGVSRRLTSHESELLYLFCKNRNSVLRRSEALEKVWHDESYQAARCMDVYITKLRALFKDDPNVEIMNVHGIGFKLVVSNGNE